jgi:hypothetical protein
MYVEAFDADVQLENENSFKNWKDKIATMILRVQVKEIEIAAARATHDIRNRNLQSLEIINIV